MSLKSAITPILLGLCFFISGCSASLPINDRPAAVQMEVTSGTDNYPVSPSPSPALPSPSITRTTEIPGSRPTRSPQQIRYDETIISETSPNGKWVISIKGYHPPVTVKSLVGGKTLVDRSMMGLVFVDVYNLNWFPDSTGFIIIGIDNVCAKNCPANRFAIFHIHEKGSLLTSYVSPSTNGGEDIGSLPIWSPDRSKFALIPRFAKSSIRIYDLQANLISSYIPRCRDDSCMIERLYWTKDGVLFTQLESPYTYIADRDKEPLPLYVIDPDHPEKPQSPYFNFPGDTKILGKDPTSTKLLIHRQAEDQNGIFEIAIFDIQSKQISIVSRNQLAFISGHQSNQDSSVIAIQAIPSAHDRPDIENLFFFYWKTRSFVNQHVVIKNLFRGWNKELGGFNLEKWNPSAEDWEAAVIKP